MLARLIFTLLVETGFCHVGQACLKLLTSGDPPASPSQSAEITSMSHHTQPTLNSEVLINVLFISNCVIQTIYIGWAVLKYSLLKTLNLLSNVMGFFVLIFC